MDTITVGRCHIAQELIRMAQKDATYVVKGGTEKYKIRLASRVSNPSEGDTASDTSGQETSTDSTFANPDEKYEQHPCCTLFPPLSEKEFELLREDISQNGQQHPILKHGNQILDGWHRFQACRELGRKARTVEWDEKGSVEEVIAGLNVARRQMNTAQKAMVAAKMVKHFSAQAKKRQLAGKRANLPANSQEGQKGEAVEQAAKLMGVSGNRVSAARRVICQGTPELAQAVQNGLISVGTAEALLKLPKKEQQRLTAEGKRALRERASKLRAQAKQAKARTEDRKDPVEGIADSKPTDRKLVASAPLATEAIEGPCAKSEDESKADEGQLADTSPSLDGDTPNPNDTSKEAVKSLIVETSPSESPLTDIDEEDDKDVVEDSHASGPEVREPPAELAAVKANTLSLHRDENLEEIVEKIITLLGHEKAKALGAILVSRSAPADSAETSATNCPTLATESSSSIQTGATKWDANLKPLTTGSKA